MSPNRFPAITIYCYCLSVGALVMLPLVEFAPGKSWADWGAMLGLGVICTYAAYMNYCAGLRRLDAGKMAVLCNLEPVLATIMAMLIWNEMFSLTGWIGAAMVLGAIFLILLDNKECQGNGARSSRAVNWPRSCLGSMDFITSGFG